MTLLNKICPHCGQTSQVYLSYDMGWECTCYRCGCIFSIPDKEIPPTLDKKFYSEHVLLQSSNVFQGSLPKFIDRRE